MADIVSMISGAVTLGKAVGGFYSKVQNSNNVAITQNIKSTFITARVFIDRNISDPEILNDVLLTAQKLYAGWVFTALQLHQVDVNSGKSLRTIVESVGTEDAKNVRRSDVDICAAFEAGVNSATTTEPSVSIKDPINPELPKSMNLPVGQIIPVEVNSGDHKLKVNLLVALFPSFISNSVINLFFNLTYPDTIQDRWFKVKTGEISFFKDFLFEIDKNDAIADALRKDKTGELQDFINNRQRGILKHVKKMWAQFVNDSKGNVNISNSIMVIDKRTFDNFCRSKHINFKNMADREKFFISTYSTCVIVVDGDYQLIDMYYAGISVVGTFSFKQLKASAKDDKVDIGNIMKAFYNNAAPKF